MLFVLATMEQPELEVNLLLWLVALVVSAIALLVREIQLKQDALIVLIMQQMAAEAIGVLEFVSNLPEAAAQLPKERRISCITLV